MDNPIQKVADAVVDTGKKAVAAYGYALTVLVVILVAIVGIDRALYVLKEALQVLLWLIEQILAL